MTELSARQRNSLLNLRRTLTDLEQEDQRILLDYSIDPDTTDCLLCVSFDSSGEATAVDLES